MNKPMSFSSPNFDDGGLSEMNAEELGEVLGTTALMYL
jgi:hypothetical protein